MRKLLLSVLIVLSGSLNIQSQTSSFVAAYDSMHQRVQIWYAFGEWKAIDWDDVNNRIRPEIMNAFAAADTIAFYLALRRYVAALPDGHVSLRGAGWDEHKASARYRQIGGSYGFALIKLDNNRLVARLVNPGSPAALAGMGFGAEILEINDQSVHDVLDTVSVLWAEANPATQECKKLNQCRFIGRAPVGSTMKVTFRNRGAADPVITTLTSVDDGYATFDQTSLLPVDPGPPVYYEILQPSGYGYLKLTTEGGDSAFLAGTYTGFREAIDLFNANDARGMILDMRINTGGEDMLSAALSGFFTSDTLFYEQQFFYNPGSGQFELWPLPTPHFDWHTLGTCINLNYPTGTLFTEPQGITFSRPVMVLTGPRDISSGEGIPMVLQRLPGNNVVSFYGSNGSFGMMQSWSYHYLYPPPNDLYFRYPVGRSMDQNGEIQLDSDSTMHGGVVPDIRVPINDTVIDQLYLDSTDVELNYAIGILNTMLGIDDQNKDAGEVILEPIFPNPVTSSATISYHLKNTTMVTLSIIDIYGRVVTTLVDEPLKTGEYTMIWHKGERKPGVYFCRIQTNKYFITQKFMVL